MKHIIILGDGMADHPIDRLCGKTLLQCAEAPYMNMLAKEGQCGRLITIPEGFHPGSEVANTSILGYDLNKVYEGRGPLEAASIGYQLQPEDMAMRCNLITLHDGRIITHNGGNLSTHDGDQLIKMLDRELGNDQIKFVTGIQYRHLLVVKKASKHIVCAPPHDHPDEPWRPLLIQSEPGWEDVREPICGADGKPTGELRLTGNETAELLNNLILKSQTLLEAHPFNQNKVAHHQRPANSIWPWGGGYRPMMDTLMQMYPQIKSGSVISAVDLIRGIGHYAGLDVIKVPGATGLANTNYEGKAQAAIEALRRQDFVYVHLEAGAGFVNTVIQGDGLLYVGTGFLITVIPILIIGPIARLKFKFNYFTIMGMIAGTYTDPPALAYANASCSKEAPAVGYSTVYPLSMFLRIFVAQICVLFFCTA